MYSSIFIIQVAKKINASHDITRVSRIVNNKMPSYCVDEALKIFDSAYSTRKNEKSKSKPLIAILGLAFRGGVSDTRLSPSYQVIKEFNSRGYNNLIVHDPFVIKDKEIESYIKNGINIELTNDMDYVLTKADLLFISTDHPDYNNLTAKDKTIPIFDGRGILDREKFRESIISTIGIGLNTNLSNKETD
jgi:UDP-N-acetyl-D-mannosaminuronate dehydrogenase